LDIIDEALLLQDPCEHKSDSFEPINPDLAHWPILDRALKKIDPKKFIYDERVNKYPAILQASSRGKSINIRMRKMEALSGG
jgi:hypothetical protein